MRKRPSTLLPIVVAAAWLLGIALPSMAPTARADTLSNGYSVTCNMNRASEVICNISGCPRVHADEAGDVVHTMIDGQDQKELSKGCNNDATETFSTPWNGFTLSVQGCRKHPLSSDDCGPWSDYKFLPPQNPPTPASDPKPTLCTAGPDQGKELPPGQDCRPSPAQAASVECPEGSVQATVPTGQQCAAPTNAVAMNITQAGLNADVVITNNSGLPAQCGYNAEKAGGLGPQTVSRSINVGPHSSGSITDMLWPPLLTTYKAEVDCLVTYNGKRTSIGHASQTVTG